MSASTKPRLLSATEAAKYLAISPRSLSELAKRGEITRRYIGNRPKYEREDLDAYIDTLPEDIGA